MSCKYCTNVEETLGMMDGDNPVVIRQSGAYLQVFDYAYPGMITSIPINHCCKCGRRLRPDPADREDDFSAAQGLLAD